MTRPHPARIVTAPALRRGGALAVLGAMLWAASPVHAQPPPAPVGQAPVFVRSVGQPGLMGTLNLPMGVAVSRGEDGRIYVVDTGNARIQALAPSGGVIGMWGSRGDRDGEFWEITDAAVSSDGRHLYVVDKRLRIVQQFDTDACLGVSRGRCFVRSWGGWGSGPGQFQDPIGIAVDRQGRVFVADWGAHVVQMFDAGGSYMAIFSHPGEDMEGLFRPSDVDVAPDGSVWVADRDHNRIYMFAVERRADDDDDDERAEPWIARPVDSFNYSGQLNQPTGVAIGPGGDFAIMDFERESGNGRLRLFDAARTLIRQELLTGDPGGDLYPHQGVAFLPGGEVVVTLLGSPDYNLLLVPRQGDIVPLAPRGHALEQFERPRGVALDPQFMVVADTNNRRVLVIDITNGDRVVAVMGDVNPVFDFGEPVGVAVHRTGDAFNDAVIYIADRARHCIFRATPSGEWLDPWGNGVPSHSHNGFSLPMAVAVDPAGLVYIADSGNDRIVVRRPDGTVARTLGRSGSGMGEFTDPISVAFGPENLLYVVERTVSRVQAFAPDGEVRGYWPGSDTRIVEPGHPWQALSLASDGSRLYVLENESTDNGALSHVRVEVFRPDVARPLGDGLLSIFAAQMGAGPGQVWDPHAIAVVPDDWVAVADTANHRIQLYHWHPERLATPTPTAAPATATAVPPTATAVPATATVQAPTATDPPPTTGAAPTVEPTASPTLATPWPDRQPTPGRRHVLSVPFVLKQRGGR